MKNNAHRPQLLTLINQLYDWGGAGAELALPFLLKHWSDAVDLTIAVPKGGEIWLRKQNVEARYISWAPAPLFLEHSHRLSHILAVWFLRTLQAMCALSRYASQYDLLYTTGDFYCTIVPATWLRRLNRNLRWAATLHHLILPHRQRLSRQPISTLGGYLLQRISLAFIRANADLIFTNNASLQQDLIQQGFSSQKTATIDAGVDVTGIQRASPVDGVSYDACYVGSFRSSKAVPELIRVWRQVVAEIPDARLLLIGSGSREMLQTANVAVNELGLERNVAMRAYVPNESEEKGVLDDTEKFRLMKSSKVFVSLSYEEGWGRAVGEALACGLPVVAWDLPAYREIFGDSVCTVPIGDRAACQRTIVQLLQNNAARREWATRGINKVRQYDFALVARRQLDSVLCLLQRV